MATLTIRQLDELTHTLLRQQAARHGRSVEAEVRAIIDVAVGRPEVNILVALGEMAHDLGGVALELPERTDMTRTVTL